MKRKRVWIPILLTLIGFGIWLEPTRVVWGWLRGEAFYDGRPTSWWATELTRWHVLDFNLDDVLFFKRQSDDAFSWLRQRIGKETDAKINMNQMVDGQAPSLLRGDDDAEPVLRVLAEHSEEQVRRLANHGLQRIHEKRHSEKMP